LALNLQLDCDKLHHPSFWFSQSEFADAMRCDAKQHYSVGSTLCYVSMYVLLLPTILRCGTFVTVSVLMVLCCRKTQWYPLLFL